MTKILIIGHNPLPFEKARKLWSGGIRTWHLTKPLADAGHEICLVCINMDEDNYMKKEKVGNINCYSLSNDKIRETSILQNIHDRFRPDCIIGINSYPSKIAAEIKSSKPIWADLNGWMMAEAQAKAYICGNKALKDFWRIESAVIKRADIFSTVSISQKYALIGELATIGRLSKETCGYDFVKYIPNATDAKTEYKRSRIVFRNKLDKNDFIILWTGGYNTWADVDTLFEGLESAMSKSPRIKFISTGGKIKGHDEKTFERFIQKIEKSRFRKNFIFLGWLSQEDVKNCYFEAAIGINSDKNIYESEIGARNRFLDMMKAGLPIVTSLKSEISHIIKENNLGFTFKPGNSNELADLILKLSKTSKNKLLMRGKKAQKYALKNFSYEATTKELLEWAKNPRHSPDYGKQAKLTDAFYFIFSKIEKYKLTWKILRILKNLKLVNIS